MPSSSLNVSLFMEIKTKREEAYKQLALSVLFKDTPCMWEGLGCDPAIFLHVNTLVKPTRVGVT